MDHENVTTLPVKKEKKRASLLRKALIFISAGAGLLIAGGLLATRKTEDEDCGCTVIYLETADEVSNEAETSA